MEQTLIFHFYTYFLQIKKIFFMFQYLLCFLNIGKNILHLNIKTLFVRFRSKMPFFSCMHVFVSAFHFVVNEIKNKRLNICTSCNLRIQKVRKFKIYSFFLDNIKSIVHLISFITIFTSLLT